MLPVALRNQIHRDIKACITEEGGDPEKCIIDVARYNGLDKDQAEEIAEDLMDAEEEE